ncbi:MAG: lipoprotein [Pseudomonadota bacterium]
MKRLTIVFVLLLTGCGQTGDLFLPQTSEPAPVSPAQDPAPADDTQDDDNE